MKYIKSKIAIIIYTILIFGFITSHFNTNKLVLLPEVNKSVREMSGSNVGVPYAFTFIGLFIAVKWCITHIHGVYHRSILILLGLISAVFSFITFMGKYYNAEFKMTIVDFFRKNGGLGNAFLIFGGGFVLFFIVLLGMDGISSWLTSREKKLSDKKKRIFYYLFDKHSFLMPCIVLAICWLPHVIIRYPGAMWIDSVNSLRQYYGEMKMTTQHPLIYTVLLAKLTDWGLSLGDGSYGLFLLTTGQTVFTLLVMAYTISTMGKFHVPYWCRGLALGIYALLPSMICYATTAVIDAPYSAAIVLLLNECIYYFYSPIEFKKSWRHLSLVMLAIGGSFFRYNGIYIVAIMLVVVIIFEIYLLYKRKQRFFYSLIIIMLMIIPTLSGKMFTGYLNTTYNAKYISTRAKYALPIQQIGRYMVYHSEDVEEQELETIQKVIKWTPEEYKKRYTPLKFDGLKAGFNNDASKEEIFQFLKVWVKLFFRHPWTYMEASLNQIYSIFSPLVDNSRYFMDAYESMKSEKFDYSYLYTGNSESSFWNELRNDLYQYYLHFKEIPVIGLIVNQAWYILILFGILAYALCCKKWRVLLLSLPLLTTLGIIIIGPAIWGHQRYLFPIMYSIPLIFGIWLVDKEDKNDGEQNEE